MTSKIIGDLSEREVKKIAEKIQRGTAEEIGAGGEGKVYAVGDYAVKIMGDEPGNRPYRHYNRGPLQNIPLVHEYMVGSCLEMIGVNTPKMYAVGKTNKGIQFLVMSPLELRDENMELNKLEEEIAVKTFNEQIELAKTNGLTPKDVKLGDRTNYGWDEKTCDGVFYDFSAWGLN